MRAVTSYRKPSGWRGNSHGHSLARKGIATKMKMVDPVFYAQKREEQVSFMMIMDMVRDGKTAQEIVACHPDADAEDLRRRGIKAVEAREGTNTLSILEKQGVDDTIRMARTDPGFKEQAIATVEHRQKASFLHPAKAATLKTRLHEVGK